MHREAFRGNGYGSGSSARRLAVTSARVGDHKGPAPPDNTKLSEQSTGPGLRQGQVPTVISDDSRPYRSVDEAGERRFILRMQAFDRRLRFGVRIAIDH